jgi:hypothetical protein
MRQRDALGLHVSRSRRVVRAIAFTIGLPFFVVGVVCGLVVLGLKAGIEAVENL